MTKKKLFTTLTLSILFQMTIFSQSDWIVTLRGDTLKGIVVINKYKTFKYKNNADFTEKEYEAIEIKECFSKGKFYVTRKISFNTTSQSISSLPKSSEPIMSSDNVILEVINNGKLNLLYYKEPDGKIHYFLEKDSKTDELIQVKFVREGSEHLVLTNDLYKITFMAFVNDCTKFLNGHNFSQLPFRESAISSMVTAYNKECGYQNYIQKKQSSNLKFSFGFGYTQRSFSSKPQLGKLYEPINTSSSGFVGVLALEYSPSRFVKNWSFDAMLSQNFFNFNGLDDRGKQINYNRFQSLFRIELLAKYRFSLNNNFKPSIFLGYAFEKDRDAASSVFNYKSPVIGLSIPFKKLSLEPRYYINSNDFVFREIAVYKAQTLAVCLKYKL